MQGTDISYDDHTLLSGARLELSNQMDHALHRRQTDGGLAALILTARYAFNTIFHGFPSVHSRYVKHLFNSLDTAGTLRHTSLCPYYFMTISIKIYFQDAGHSNCHLVILTVLGVTCFEHFFRHHNYLLLPGRVGLLPFSQFNALE